MLRTTLKIVLPLIVSVAVVFLLFAGHQVRMKKNLLRNNLSHRAEILGESLQESAEPLLERGQHRNLQGLVERFGQREPLKGVAVYSGGGAPLEVNALQRASTIVIQKSPREGFGLTVSEALSKRKSGVASAVGGIPLPVIHKHTELLTHSVEGTAYQEFTFCSPTRKQPRNSANRGIST